MTGSRARFLRRGDWGRSTRAQLRAPGERTSGSSTSITSRSSDIVDVKTLYLGGGKRQNITWHPYTPAFCFRCSPWVNHSPRRRRRRQRAVQCASPMHPLAAQFNTRSPGGVPLTHHSTHSTQCPPFPRHRWTTLSSFRWNAVSPQYHALSTPAGERDGSILHPNSSIMHWLERGGRRL